MNVRCVNFPAVGAVSPTVRSTQFPVTCNTRISDIKHRLKKNRYALFREKPEKKCALLFHICEIDKIVIDKII